MFRENIAYIDFFKQVLKRVPYFLIFIVNADGGEQAPRLSPTNSEMIGTKG